MTTSAMQPRPWHRLYPEGVPPEVGRPPAGVLTMFQQSLARDAAAPCLHYFGRTLSRGEVDALSERLGSGLAARGVVPGDRVAIALQNTPVFVLATVAAWKCGATVVPVNPMLRAPELKHVVEDSGCRVLLSHPEMADVVEQVRRSTHLEHVLWSRADDLAGDLPAPWGEQAELAADAVLSELALERPRVDAPREQAPALLTYTSGTTGRSKGAVNSHRNLAYQAVVGRQWFDVQDGGVLAVAPLFHITGLGVHLALALANGFPLVLTHRFDPATVAALCERYRPSFVIGAITAFIALMNSGVDRASLACLTSVFSGGAPVPEAVVQRYEAEFGTYIYNAYGLTESTSACIAVPKGVRAPVDPGSGALSIGVPLPGADVWVVDEQGERVDAGELGELVVRGPQVVAGYWQLPEESERAIPGGELHTGDVGFMNADGWVFLVDRKKDMIIASGFKVWPREVEDVLYEHPAVEEAAVVGVPDDYRGETVHAYVTVQQGAEVTPAELQSHCRERLSAYKVPREVVLVTELPKTATGKILRRDVRQQAARRDS
ncbi:MAG: AMP-binding protein [Mycobacteriales bacterium]